MQSGSGTRGHTGPGVPRRSAGPILTAGFSQSMWQCSWPQERGLTASSTLSSIQKPGAIYTRSQQAPKLLGSLRGSVIKIIKTLLEANLSGKESHRSPVSPVTGLGNAFLRALAQKGATARLQQEAQPG